MKQCYGYVRVSTKKQGEGVSLDAQKDAILHFAASNDIKIIQWFEEQQTAAKRGRPVFAAMLKSLRQKKCAVGVIMHKVDRSARNFADWAKIADLADAGIEVHFAAESLDFNSRGGRLSADIQAVIASDFIRNHKTEVRKGQRGRLSRGLYPFTAPLGYLDNGKGKLKTIDPVRGPLVREAFELFGSGQYNLRSLTKEMAERGLRNKYGNTITFNRWAEILDNPFYTGIIKIRRTGDTYQGKHKPLITMELFQRVSRVRSAREHKLTTKHNHLYRGLFKCGNCQRSMIPERQKGHVYYRCQRPTCRGNSVREEDIDLAVNTSLATIRTKETHFAEIAQWAKQLSKQSNQTATQNTYTIQLQQADQKLEKLEDALFDGLIERDRFAVRKDKLLQERAAIVDAQSKAEQQRRNPPKVEAFLELANNLAQQHKIGTPPEKREITEIAFSNRTVVEKKVTIEPRNWLEATRESCAVLSSVLDGFTNRTPTSQERKSLQNLITAANSSEVDRLFRLFMGSYAKSAGLDDWQDNPPIQ